jgi:hypothetical protein
MSFADKLAGIGSSLTGIAELGGLASIAGVAALGRQWADTGSKIGRTAALIGVSAQRLQSLQGAAYLFGLQKDDMTNDFQAFAKTLEDATNGRNTAAMMMLQRQRIGLKTDAKGNIDTADALYQMADRIYKMKGRPQAQGVLAGMFGLNDILPLLQQGPKAMAGLEQTYRKSGAIMGPKAIQQATDFTAALHGLKSAIDGVGNSLAGNMMPKVTELTKRLSNSIASHQTGIADQITHAISSAMGFPTDIFLADKPKQPAAKSGAAKGRARGTPAASAPSTRLQAALNNAGVGRAAGVISQLDLIQMLERSGDSAVSPAGAIGKYQVMPGTAAWMRKKFRLPQGSLFDPGYNKLMANTYLGYLSDRFKGDLDAMVIGYNAGPGAAKRYLQAGRDPQVLPDETQKYLKRSHLLEAVFGMARQQMAQAPQKVDLDVRFHGLPAGVTATATQRQASNVKVRGISVDTEAL